MIRKQVGRLYELRSAFVHTGEVLASESQRREVLELVRTVLNVRLMICRWHNLKQDKLIFKQYKVGLDIFWLKDESLKIPPIFPRQTSSPPRPWRTWKRPSRNSLRLRRIFAVRTLKFSG